MQLILIFLLIFCFGYLLSSLIVRSLPFLERIGVSFILGLGLTTLFIFFNSWLGIKITTVNTLLLILFLIAVTALISNVLKINLEFRVPDFPKLYLHLKPYEKAISFLILAIFCLSFLLSSYFPVYVWDALALYDFTARIIAETGYFVQVAQDYFYFAQYPLLVPLGHTIVYLFGGTNPQFIYSLYFVSFVVIFFSAVRSVSSRSVALIAVLFLATNPQLFAHSTFSYTNLPYTVFYVSGVIYLYTAIVKSRNDYLLMSAILLGLSTWTRSAEPLWLAEGFVLLVYAIYKRSFKPFFIFSIPFFIIQQPWSQFQANLYGTAVSTAGQISLIPSLIANGIDFGRILDVSFYIYKNIIQSWGPIIALFVISVIFDLKNGIHKNNLIMLAIIMANLAALYAGTYLFSLRFPEWKDIPGSAIRLAMFFPPLMIYYTCLVFGDRSQETKIDK